MDLTKQQKMLIGTLVAGVVSIGVDQFVLAPPDGANASVTDKAAAKAAPAAPAAGPSAAPLLKLPGGAAPGTSDSASAQNATPAAEGGDDSLPSFEALTRRLTEIETSQSAGPLQTDLSEDADPFALPKRWETQPVDVAVEPKDPKTTNTVDTAKQLLAQYRLEATYRSASEGKVSSLAVVNGRVMGLGYRIKVRLSKPLEGSEHPYEVYKLVRIIVGDRGPSEVVWESEHDPTRRVVMKADPVLSEGDQGDF